MTVTNVTAAQTITANFAIDTFAISFVSGGNGTLTGTASQTINYNGSATAVTAGPATGYHFVNWTGTGGFVTTTTNPLTVTNVTAAQTITANFAIDTYTVTASAGTGGTISPSTPQIINYGSTTQFTVTPATGYSILSVTGCGGTLAGSTYTSGAITGDCTVTATFKKKNYQVTPSAGTNGTISPAGVQTINYGATTTFTVTPSAGYSASVGGTCGGSLSGTTYTTNAITANCTVTASFTATTPNVCTYTITPTSQSFDSSSGTATVSVTKSSTACVWLAVSNAPWITITAGSIGEDNSTVNFTVSSNTGTPRIGTLTIAGQTFTVTQTGIQHTLILTKSGTGSGKGLINNSDNVVLCGADSEVAVLKYDTGTAVTLSAAPETGSTFNGWNSEACPEIGACTLTITLNGDTSINAVFSAAAAPVTDLSTGTLVINGNEVYINVPVIKYINNADSTVAYYSAEFMYVLTDDNKIWFKLTRADVVADITPYSSTQMSQLYFAGSDLMLHLNNITINGSYLWADLKYMPTSDGKLWFVVTGAGTN